MSSIASTTTTTVTADSIELEHAYLDSELPIYPTSAEGNNDDDDNANKMMNTWTTPPSPTSTIHISSSHQQQQQQHQMIQSPSRRRPTPSAIVPKKTITPLYYSPLIQSTDLLAPPTINNNKIKNSKIGRRTRASLTDNNGTNNNHNKKTATHHPVLLLENNKYKQIESIPEHLKTHEGRWDFQSKLAGTHKQSVHILDLSHRSFTPESLKFGLTPDLCSHLTDFRFDADLCCSTKTQELLPSFVEMFCRLFPNLQHLTLVGNSVSRKRYYGTEKNDHSNNNTYADSVIGDSLFDSMYDDDDEGKLYNEDGEEIIISSHTTTKTSTTSNDKTTPSSPTTADLLNHEKMDSILEEANRESTRIQRLYILYRMPDLVSINGISVTQEERDLARPSSPTGQKVNWKDWLNQSMGLNGMNGDGSGDGGGRIGHGDNDDDAPLQYFCSEEDEVSIDAEEAMDSYEIALEECPFASPAVLAIAATTTPTPTTTTSISPNSYRSHHESHEEESVKSSTLSYSTASSFPVDHLLRTVLSPPPNTNNVELEGDFSTRTDTFLEGRNKHGTNVTSPSQFLQAAPPPPKSTPKGLGIFPHTGRAIPRLSSIQETSEEVATNGNSGNREQLLIEDEAINIMPFPYNPEVVQTTTTCITSGTKKQISSTTTSTSTSPNKKSSPKKNLDSYLNKSKNPSKLALSEATDEAVSGHLVSQCLSSTTSSLSSPFSTRPRPDPLRDIQRVVKEKENTLTFLSDNDDGDHDYNIPHDIPLEVKECTKNISKRKNMTSPTSKGKRGIKEKGTKKKSSKDRSLNVVPSMVKVRLKKGKKKEKSSSSLTTRPPPSPASLPRTFTMPRQKQRNKKKHRRTSLMDNLDEEDEDSEEDVDDNDTTDADILVK